jgi:hypothetical protein
MMVARVRIRLEGGRVRLVVWRRCILESKLGAEECADRLGRVTQRIKLPFVRRPLVGWASRDAFSVRWVGSRTMLMARANGTFVPAPGPAVEIRVELGVSVIELVVVLLFAAFYLLGALTPGYLASDLILGAMFLAWVGFFVLVLARWNRGADRLVQILAATCEAAARQE